CPWFLANQRECHPRSVSCLPAWRGSLDDTRRSSTSQDASGDTSSEIEPKPKTGSSRTMATGNDASSSGVKNSPFRTRQAERLAKRILSRSMLRPGSAPSAIAKANGVHVSVRSNLGLGVRGCTDPFLRSIYVAPYSHQPRAEWVIGHELAELEIPEHLGDDHEHVCQAIAARLMMPTREFFDSGSSCDWDLAVLRQWWPHCSWQAMARRVAEV